MSGAKLLAGEAAVVNGKSATQVHGGMGFTWEVDVHLYLKRAWVLDTVFGSGDSHADAVAATSRPVSAAEPPIGESWQPLLDDLDARHAEARGMGGPERLERQREGGRLDARQRVARLLDPDSFVELGALTGTVQRGVSPVAPADALVAGHGTIDGRPVLVGAEDFTVMGGSIGLATSAKRHRLTQLAEQERVPLVMLLEGAGDRAQNAFERRGRAPNDLQALVALSGLVPTVCVVMGPSAGHGALTAPLMDFVVMVEGAALFSAGPPLVQAAIGEEVTKEELGGTPVHTVVSGVAHNQAPDDAAALDLVRQYLSYLPSNAWTQPPAVTGDDTGPRRLDEPPRPDPGRSATRLRRADGDRTDLRFRECARDRAGVRSDDRDRVRAPRRRVGRGGGEPARGEGGLDRRRLRRQGRALPRGRRRVPRAGACSWPTTRACSRAARRNAAGSCVTRPGCSRPRPGSRVRSCT